MIGRKASVGGFGSPLSKPKAQPWIGGGVLQNLSVVEVGGTLGGPVKWVDIKGNTSGEGALLGHY